MNVKTFTFSETDIMSLMEKVTVVIPQKYMYKGCSIYTRSISMSSLLLVAHSYMIHSSKCEFILYKLIKHNVVIGHAQLFRNSDWVTFQCFSKTKYIKFWICLLIIKVSGATARWPFTDSAVPSSLLLFLLGDDPCKHGLLQLSWQNYHNDIDNLFKALLK